MRQPLHLVRSLCALAVLALIAAPASGQSALFADAQPADLTPTPPVIHAQVISAAGEVWEVVFSEGSAVHVKDDGAETSLRLAGSVEADGSVSLTVDQLALADGELQASETVRLTLDGGAHEVSLAPFSFNLVEVNQPPAGTAASCGAPVGQADYRFVDNAGPPGGPVSCCTNCDGVYTCCEVSTPGACCEVFAPCNGYIGYCKACAPNVQTVP